MLTDPKLRAQVDALWDKFWMEGPSNPLSQEKLARVESLRRRMGESTRQVEGCLRVCWRNLLTVDGRRWTTEKHGLHCGRGGAGHSTVEWQSESYIIV
jgi:hypothetical protein